MSVANLLDKLVGLGVVGKHADGEGNGDGGSACRWEEAKARGERKRGLGFVPWGRGGPYLRGAPPDGRRVAGGATIAAGWPPRPPPVSCSVRRERR